MQIWLNDKVNNSPKRPLSRVKNSNSTQNALFGESLEFLISFIVFLSVAKFRKNDYQESLSPPKRIVPSHYCVEKTTYQHRPCRPSLTGAISVRRGTEARTVWGKCN